jgi:hypothetical protein
MAYRKVKAYRRGRVKVKAQDQQARLFFESEEVRLAQYRSTFAPC